MRRVRQSFAVGLSQDLDGVYHLDFAAATCKTFRDLHEAAGVARGDDLCTRLKDGVHFVV